MSATGQRIAFDREQTAHLVENVSPGPHVEWETLARTPFRASMAYCAATADFLTVAMVVLVAGILLPLPVQAVGSTHSSVRELLSIALGAALLVVSLLKSDGAYRGIGSMLCIRETERALRIPAQAFLVLFPLTFLAHLSLSRTAMLWSLLLVPFALILEKQLFAAATRMLVTRGSGGRRIAVYGAGCAGRRVVSMLFNSPWLGLQPAVAIDDDPDQTARRMFELGYRRRQSVPVRCGPATPMLLKSCECEILVIATPNLAPNALSTVARAAKQAGMQLAYMTDSAAPDSQIAAWTNLDGLLATSGARPVATWHYRALKRITDVALSSVLLTLLTPLLLTIALLVRLDSRGRALFIQKRVGQNGKLFDIYKFRSMYIDVPRYDPSPASPDDQRITRMGRFLRRTSLDELPQLVNVLLGNMSLVGPRPEMPFIVDFYSSRERDRLRVVPGITGLWQLSADRGSPIHENIEYDLYYIKNRSFFLDMAILLHTVFCAMRGV